MNHRSAKRGQAKHKSIRLQEVHQLGGQESTLYHCIQRIFLRGKLVVSKECNNRGVFWSFVQIDYHVKTYKQMRTPGHLGQRREDNEKRVILSHSFGFLSHWLSYCLIVNHFGVQVYLRFSPAHSFKLLSNVVSFRILLSPLKRTVRARIGSSAL